MLDSMVRGRSVADALEGVCRWVESQHKIVHAAVLLADDRSRTLSPAAGPRIPPEVAEAFKDFPYGPRNASCGKSIWRGERVICEDIAADPLWDGYRDVVMEHGLKACWSCPITTSEGAVLGTMAFMFRTRRKAVPKILETQEVAARLAASIIERDRAESRNAQQNEALIALSRRMNRATGDLDCVLRVITETGAGTLQTDRCSIWLAPGPDTGARAGGWVCRDLYVLHEERHSSGERFNANERTAYLEAIRNDRALAITSSQNDDRLNEAQAGYVGPNGIKSTLDAPVWHDGEVVGILTFEQTSSERKWSVEDRNFAASLADQTAIAIESSIKRERETELGRNHEMLETMLQTMEQGVIVCGTDLRIVTANTKICRILNVDDQYLHRGRSIADLIGLAAGRGDYGAGDPKHRTERILRLFAGKESFAFQRTIHGKAMLTQGQPMPGGGWVVTITDLSDHVGSGAAAREREQTLEKVTEGTASMLWMSLANGHSHYFNRAWLKFRGTSLEDEIGIGWEEGAHPEDRDLIVKQSSSYWDRRDPYTNEYRLQRHDGVYRTVRETAKPYWNDAGVFLGYVGSCVDVTVENDALAELRDREALLAAIGENSPAKISVKDTDGRFKFVNKAFADSLGLPAGDIIGKFLPDLYEPADAKVYQGHDADVVAAAGPIVREAMLPVGGVQVPHLLVKFPIRDEDGQVTGIGAILSDMSEALATNAALEEKQLLLETSIAAIEDGFIIFDDQERMVMCNEQYREIYAPIGQSWETGISIEQIARDTAIHCVGLEDNGELDAWLDERLSLFRKHGRMEQRLKDGRWIIARQFRLSNGWSVGVRTDVTILKQREEALALSEARLQMALDGTMDGIWDWNIADGSCFRSRRWLEMLGFESGEGREDENLWDNSLHPDFQQIFDAAINPHLEGIKPNFDVEVQVVRQDGDVIWVLDRGKVTERDADGRPTRMVGALTDITERKQAELDKRETEEWLQSIFDHAPFLMALKDTEGRAVRVNEEYRHFYGLEPREMAGRTVHEIFEPEMAQSFRDHEIEVLEAGHSIERELVNATPHGDRLVREVKFPLRDSDGKIKGLGFIGIDVTEERAAQEALERKEALLRTISDNAPAEFSIKDRDGRYLMVNRWFCENFGVREDQVIGQRLEDVFPGEIAKVTQNHDQEVFRTGKTVARERKLIIPEGNPIHMIVKFPIPGPGGEVESVGCLTVDITDLRAAELGMKESETRLHTITENAPAIVYLKSPDKRYLMINRAFEEAYGLDRADVLGKTTREVFEGDAPSIFEESDDAVLVTGEPVVRELKDPLDSCGRVLHVVKFPVFDDDGEMVAIGGIETDITDRKIVEREIREARDSAEAANRSKSDFLANMSHELRTPLNAILGFSEILSNELFGKLGNERYAEYVGDIRSSGELLLSLIDDILDLSRIEAGRVKLDFEVFGAADAIRHAARLIDDHARHSGVTIDVDLPEPDIDLEADPRAFKQIVTNLLSNAVKFTPEGGRVDLRTRISDDGRFAVIVSDTGVGMSKDDIPTALSTFGQVDNPHVRRHNKGSGLGLPMVRNLVELHGGSLDIESTLGAGTTVTCYFGADCVADSAPLRPRIAIAR